MMDEIDRAGDHIEKTEAAAIAAARTAAANILVGEPGICEYCDEYKARLVDGACGRCRDIFKK